MSMFRFCLLTVFLAFAACSDREQAPPVSPVTPPPADEPADTPDPVQALIERGKRLELDTPYVPPPGDPDAHFTMGFARTLCSGVFVSGLDEEFAAENIGYFTSPPETRSVVVERHVDYDARTVSLTTASGITSSGPVAARSSPTVSRCRCSAWYP